MSVKACADWTRDKFLEVQGEGAVFAEDRFICLPCGSMEAGWRVGSEDRDRHTFEELRAEQEAVEVRAGEEGICWVHHQLVKEDEVRGRVTQGRRFYGSVK